MRPAGPKDYSLKKCQERLHRLNSRAEGLLDKLVSSLEHEERLSQMSGDIEQLFGRCEALSRIEGQSELELNEAVVVADKLEGDLEEIRGVVEGAVVLSNHEKFASQVESLKKLFYRLERKLGDIHEAAEGGYGVVDLLSKFSSFEEDAARAERGILAIERGISIESEKKKSKLSGRMQSARGHILSVRKKAGVAQEKRTLERIRHSIEEKRRRIADFMIGEKSGRMSIDRKHLTMRSQTSGRRVSIEFTEATKYALLGMLGTNPISAKIRKLPENHAVLSAYFEPSPRGSMVRLGEKKVHEEGIVFSSLKYEVPLY